MSQQSLSTVSAHLSQEEKNNIGDQVAVEYKENTLRLYSVLQEIFKKALLNPDAFLMKRLIVSYKENGQDPIRLVLDNDPNIPITASTVAEATIVKLTDSGDNSTEYVKFDEEVALFADISEHATKALAIDYSGGVYTFRSRYSITNWGATNVNKMHRIQAFIHW
jgi:hypothetical protein